MRKFLLAATFSFGATAAHAQLPDAYVGAGITQAHIGDIFGSSRAFNLDNTSWKAYLGIRPFPFLGVEANYMDLGRESHSYGFNNPGNARVDAHAFSAFAVGFLPIPVPLVDIFFKAGAARWTLGGQPALSPFSLNEHGTDFAWGAGTQTHFGPLGLRLEYEQFDVQNTSGVRAVSFDVSWHIL